MLIKWSAQVGTWMYWCSRWPFFSVFMRYFLVIFVHVCENCARECEMRVCLPCAEKLQAKQAHLVWKTEWKRGGSKLLISDRQSSLSCDSIAVEWSPGVCELSLWHIPWWGVKVSEKDSQMNTEIRKMAGGESLADQLCLKWPLYVSAMRLPPLSPFSS